MIMKHKSGDKVRIKSLEWYNENKGKGDMINVDPGFIRQMSKYCGEIAIITQVSRFNYRIDLDFGTYKWTDYMFEDTAAPPCVKSKRKPFIRLRALGNVKY